LVFEKTPNFFAENWQKSQKIVIIITSTPENNFFVGEELDLYTTGFAEEERLANSKLPKEELHSQPSQVGG
jgi:hypothetical protein